MRLEILAARAQWGYHRKGKNLGFFRNFESCSFRSFGLLESSTIGEEAAHNEQKKMMRVVVNVNSFEWTRSLHLIILPSKYSRNIFSDEQRSL